MVETGQVGPISVRKYSFPARFGREHISIGRVVRPLEI